MYLNREPTYDKEPTIEIKGCEGNAWQGYSDILQEIKRAIFLQNKEKAVIVIETYPAVRKEEIIGAFEELNPALVVDADRVTFDEDKIFPMIEKTLTDDPVLGIMSHFTIDDFIDSVCLQKAKEEIQSILSGVVIVYGFGASKIVSGDLLIYADITRWEIQFRYRSGEVGNWKANNSQEDLLRKYKRGFFFEWRVADRIKKQLFERMDYLLDTNAKDHPKMISGTALLHGLEEVVKRPFRLVPYFDPGVWGGQWMKEVFGLDKREKNYAWSFDGVPEENSLYLKYGDVRVEVPSINVVFYQPIPLLGDKVHARFGTEFPIRFDFLDTMGGGNLSLQVHPLVEYIQDKFGMNYTQDESYYMLDTANETYVYLGLKEGVNKEEMLADLRGAQGGEEIFPAEKYVNKLPAKKHDHFLIPAGTIHCSATDSMVLEISATPYIFTFKLWDWGQVGLNGKPRPLHLEHGEQSIQWDRQTSWVEDNLVNHVELLEKGDGYRIEKTGLHKRQFIETHRHWFTKEVHHKTNDSVNVLNLVEGEEAIVESPTDAFEPFIVHYAETFIIPEGVKEYTIRPYGAGEGKELATIKAYVRC